MAEMRSVAETRSVAEVWSVAEAETVAEARSVAGVDYRRLVHYLEPPFGPSYLVPGHL